MNKVSFKKDGSHGAVVGDDQLKPVRWAITHLRTEGLEGSTLVNQLCLEPPPSSVHCLPSIFFFLNNLPPPHRGAGWSLEPSTQKK